MSNLAIKDEEITTALPAGFEQHGSLAVSLARAEVDQQIATARAMPRSIHRAVKNITTLATLDEQSAEECIYALPRGGKPIKGPSVRLAEIIASQWGNCRVGARVVHVDRIEKYVEAEGVFHDLETNTATTARVRRRISNKHGKVFEDDMIVVTGNAACAIAKRNAILGSVPKAVWRKAYEAVESVITGDVKTLAERRSRALAAFGAFGVTPEQIFGALGVGGEDDIGLEHLGTLTAMRSALKNGESTVEEMFPKPEAKGAPAKSLGEKLDALGKKPGEREPAHDAETGEITQQHDTYETDAGAGDPSSQAAGADAGARDSASAASAADQDGEQDERTEEEKLLDDAREKSLEGRRTFDAWFNRLRPEQVDSLNPHMRGLMAAAKQADDAAKKTGA